MFFASFLELVYRAEELKYAEHDADDVVDSDERTYETEDDSEYRYLSKKTDNPADDSRYNEKDNELNNEWYHVLLFDLEGSGPEFFKHIHFLYLRVKFVWMNYTMRML